LQEKLLHAISYIYYSLPFSLDDFYPSIPSFLFVIGCVILLVYYVGYRKTVRANIALALPHLSPEERLSIEKNHTAIYVICLWK
jgi:lauroyl/myristoyl acyltransferase